MKHFTNLKSGLKSLGFNHFRYPKDIFVYNEEVLFDLVDCFVDQVLNNLDNPVKVMLAIESKGTKDKQPHYYNLTKLMVVTKDNASFLLT